MSIPFNTNRPLMLNCHLLAPTSDRPASGGDEEEEVFLAVGHRRSAVRGASPQATSGNGPVAVQMVISHGEC